MPFLPFPEFRPDVDDLRGEHTQMIAGVLPRADGWGPMADMQAYSFPLAVEGIDTFTNVLLHFDGADGTSVFTDTALGINWSQGGNAVLDSAEGRFGSSLICDGVGDYVTTPDVGDLTLGSSDFTIECWFNVADVAGNFRGLAGQGDPTATAANESFGIFKTNTDVMTARVVVGTTYYAVLGTTQFTNTLNQGFHHLAFIRTGNILRLFIDGEQEGGDTPISGSVNDSSYAVSVGRLGELPSTTWYGWIDEFSISIGIARWTTDFSPPAAVYDTAANCICRGMFYARVEDGSIAIFAATAVRLLKFNAATLEWEDVSQGGVVYSTLPETAQWQFAQFGAIVIAVQPNVNPQAFALGSSTAFADLGGSPPNASYVTVVGLFLVLSGLVDDPLRVHTSGLDNILEWTPGISFANTYDFPDGGIVRGVAGGEFGIIMQESTIRRMVYVPGAEIAFQVERISEEKGLLGPYSIVRAGERVLFFSAQGFQEYTNVGGLTPIGKERIDRTFLADLDQNVLRLFIGASDPAGTRAFWAYKSTSGGSSTAFDKVICYDVILKRFSPPLNITGEYIAPIVKPGLTLESLDALGTLEELDQIIGSLDSIQAAGNAQLAGFNSSHQLAFFDGANIEAVLETPEQGLENRRMFVRGFHVRSDAPLIYGRLRHRANAQTPLLSETAETAVNGEGFSPQRLDTRLARGRIRVPAGTVWTYAAGIEPNVIRSGEH